MPKTSLHLTIFLVSSLIFSSFATSDDISDNLDDLRFLWSHWKNFYHKTYTPTQEPYKFLVFVNNYQKVVAYNAQSSNVKLSLNKFADLTPMEFKSFLSLEPTRSIMKEPQPLSSTSENLKISLPKSIDWRLKGAVSPVKNQGQSNSCWLFASTDALESLYFIQTGELIAFSQQQLLDCVPGTPVCKSQDFINAFNYTAQYGIETEKDYPDTGGQGTCHYDASKAIKVNSNYTLVKPKSSKALKEALTQQPVPVFIEADQFVFQFYSSGVIDSDSCGANVDHGVLVVGYDVVSGKEAFIVKNSWGIDWGVQGYVYISTNNTPHKEMVSVESYLNLLSLLYNNYIL